MKYGREQLALSPKPAKPGHGVVYTPPIQQRHIPRVLSFLGQEWRCVRLILEFFTNGQQQPPKCFGQLWSLKKVRSTAAQACILCARVVSVHHPLKGAQCSIPRNAVVSSLEDSAAESPDLTPSNTPVASGLLSEPAASTSDH